MSLDDGLKASTDRLNVNVCEHVKSLYAPESAEAFLREYARRCWQLDQSYPKCGVYRGHVQNLVNKWPRATRREAERILMDSWNEKAETAGGEP